MARSCIMDSGSEFDGDNYDDKNNINHEEEQGVGGLAEIINKLKNIFIIYSRTILSAWDRADLRKVGHSPCHMFTRFYVSYPGAILKALDDETKPRGVLHSIPLSILYHWLCDVVLGAPFNIASYALPSRG